MNTSPVSTTLFCSSPHPHTSQGPAEEVNEIALEAQNVHTLNPAVAAVLQDPDKRKDFLHHMNRQIQLIKSRSQAFEDAHVTVYDKTLLTLTSNGNKLDHPPAIEYYCDEFLGVSNIADQVLATRMLEQSICVPKLLAQGKHVATSVPTHHVDFDKSTLLHLPIPNQASKASRYLPRASAVSQRSHKQPLIAP